MEIREILFRGKAITDSEWGEGNLIHNGKECQIWSIEGKFLTSVDTKTVSEFTGLRDKHGKRIFEGDILSQNVILTNGRAVTRTVLIGFDCGAFCYVDVGIKGWECRNPIAICDNWDGIVTNEWGVIGNKWDNPELLENKQ